MNRRPSRSRGDYDSFAASRTARFTAASPDGRFFEPQKKRSPLALALAFAALLLIAVLAVNLIVNQFVHVARVSVPVKGLHEAFEGYTFLHISDLKGMRFGSEQGLFRFALAGKEFDAVVLTGDMVSSLGNAEPLYELLDVLRELDKEAPIYFIAGDGDPVVSSMDYAAGGSPFAPWVLGAQQRGAQLLSAPMFTEKDGQKLWLLSGTLLSLDIETMQGQYEQQYLKALDSGDDNEIELATHNLRWLSHTRDARAVMQEGDITVSLSHAPPSEQELSTPAGSPDLTLCGHYLGGLIRLPVLGAAFIPSRVLPRYGLFPGASTYYGLTASRPYVYTSPGLGSSDSHYPRFFFRLFNPPTVTLVSLTPSAL